MGLTDTLILDTIQFTGDPENLHFYITLTL